MTLQPPRGAISGAGFQLTSPEELRGISLNILAELRKLTAPRDVNIRNTTAEGRLSVLSDEAELPAVRFRHFSHTVASNAVLRIFLPLVPLGETHEYYLLNVRQDGGPELINLNQSSGIGVFGSLARRTLGTNTYVNFIGSSNDGGGIDQVVAPHKLYSGERLYLITGAIVSIGDVWDVNYAYAVLPGTVRREQDPRVPTTQEGGS